MIIAIPSALFVALGLYVFVATLLCCEIKPERFHWWCPCCQFGKWMDGTDKD